MSSGKLPVNHYDASPPRALLGLAALAISAITIGAMVVVPAKLDASTTAHDRVAATVTCNAIKDQS
jgi:hypothetical protein